MDILWEAWEEGLPLTGVSMGEDQPGDGGAGQALRLEQEVARPWVGTVLQAGEAWGSRVSFRGEKGQGPMAGVSTQRNT